MSYCFKLKNLEMRSKKERLAAIVKQKRLEKGLTQTELSEHSRISLRSVQRIEKAEVLPRAFTIEALAKTLDFSPQEIEPQEVPPAENTPTNRPQKTILSLGSGLVFTLLALAFLSQARNFPENTFELLLFWAGVVLFISLVQWLIWKRK